MDATDPSEPCTESSKCAPSGGEDVGLCPPITWNEEEEPPPPYISNPTRLLAERSPPPTGGEAGVDDAAAAFRLLLPTTAVLVMRPTATSATKPAPETAAMLPESLSHSGCASLSPEFDEPSPSPPSEGTVEGAG